MLIGLSSERGCAENKLYSSQHLVLFNRLLSVFYCVIWWILSKQSAAAALTRLNCSGVRGAELEERQKQIKTGSVCAPCAQPTVVHSYLTFSHKQTQGIVCIIKI